MKCRQSAVYLSILLLIGGYYFYFEVMKKEQKLAADQAAKRMFHFQAEQVQGIEIYPKDKATVLLKKENQWQVMQPVRSETDKGAMEDLLRTLGHLESERTLVESTPSDLKDYGLKDPSLKIRFQVQEKWMELLLGDKTPVGDGRYAMTSEKAGVFLIAEGNWGVLNKGANELRKRELFTFQPEEVIGLQVAWQDGTSVSVEKRSEGDIWEAAGQPGVKIKKSKVDNVLEQIHWLRAQSFLENEAVNLESHGLKPPRATVSLRLKNEQKVDLLLAEKGKETNQVAALSSQLPGVVQVEGAILEDLPRKVQGLEDRSLVGVKSDSVKQIKWNLGSSTAQVMWMGENKWGLVKSDKETKPLKDSWRVKSLLWDAAEAEYLSKLEPQPASPSEPYARLELSDGEKTLAVLFWEKQEKKAEPMAVWVQKGNETGVVQVKTETVDKLVKDFEMILQPEQPNSGS